MVRKLFTLALLAVVLMLVALPASATLVPMSWGFPILKQDNTLTSFENATALSTDNAVAAVSFPTTTGSSVFTSAFPTIAQTGDKTDFMQDIKFQQQTQDMTFAYPFLSVGGSPIPSMGML